MSSPLAWIWWESKRALPAKNERSILFLAGEEVLAGNRPHRMLVVVTPSHHDDDG
jgi:hypothetical protein